MAKSQVVAFVRKYYATLDRLASSSAASLNELDTITTDAKDTQEKTTLAEYRANGWVEKGTTTLVTSKVTSVDLTKTATTRPTVHVTTCLDLTKVKEVDKNGKIVTLPTRPNYLVEQLTVVNINYPSAEGWRVSAAPNKGATSCAGV